MDVSTMAWHQLTILALLLTQCTLNSADPTMYYACEHCDANYLPYPNMNAALYGYDLSKADPFSTAGIGGDPGWRNPVFVPTEYNDGRVTLHESIDAKDSLNCNAKFTQKFITNVKQYKKEQLTSIYSGYDLKLGQEIEIEAEGSVPVGPPIPAEVSIGIKAKIPPFLRRSSSETEKESNMQDFFSKEKGGMLILEATCSVHVVKVVPNTTPHFASGFKAGVAKLWKAVQEQLDYDDGNETIAGRLLNQTEGAFDGFIWNFGTHYSRSTTMGSKLIYERRFSEKERNEVSKTTLDNCAKVDGLKVFGFQVEDDSNKCEKKNTDKTSLNSQNMVREKFTSFGSKPAGTIAEWAEQSMEKPVPLKMALVPLIHLFSLQNLKAMELQNPDITEHTHARFATKVMAMWGDVCRIAYNNTCGSSSPSDVPVCGVSDDCGWEERCEEGPIEDGKKTHMCLPNAAMMQCQANPDERAQCEGTDETTKQAECESRKGCCFTPNFHTKCYTRVKPQRCSINPLSRIPCGGRGNDITEEHCKKLGCCYNKIEQDLIDHDRWTVTINGFQTSFRALSEGLKYASEAMNVSCFYERQNDECSVNPTERELCGPPAISGADCLAKGCCYSDYDVPEDLQQKFTVKACYHRRTPNKCSVNPYDRVECGWDGISEAECLAAKCCYDGTGLGKKCFYQEAQQQNTNSTHTNRKVAVETVGQLVKLSPMRTPMRSPMPNGQPAHDVENAKTSDGQETEQG